MNASEIQVTVTKSPSYLQSLLSTVDDIILIHKANDLLINESFDVTRSPIKQNKDEDNIFDITGSPLKVNLHNSSCFSIESTSSCMNFWHKNEEKHSPFPYYSAQKHIQEYLLKYKNELGLPTWWVLDATDEDKTILLSAIQLPTSISRSVVKLRGYLPKSHPSIVFDALCNKHFEIVSELTAETHKIPLRQLTSNVSSIYELCGSKITAMNFDDKCDIQGSVYLDISWNQCCAEIPLDHARSTMTIQTVVGQQDSILSRFWKELILLELYARTLHDYNSETMLNSHWLPSHGNISDDSSLIDRVVETVYSCQDTPRYNCNNEDEIELQKIIQHVDKRHTCDITDQLWIILNKCPTYGNLTDCLNIVFTEIINSDRSVYIADSNMTSMAQIIRDIVAGKTSVFMLTGTQPIEILIDIGLEKLRKDFSFILTHFGIAAEQDLLELFKISSGQSAENTLNKDKSKHIRSALYHKKSLLNLDCVESRLKILGQLHTVLEALILVPSFWQSLSTKTVFDHFVGNDSPIDSFSDLARNKLYEIQVDLPVSKVYEYIKTLSPIMWRLSLTLSKPSFSVKNVFHLSQHQIFPHVMYKPDIMHETIGDANEAYYHYTLLTEMINFIKTNLV